MLTGGSGCGGAPSAGIRLTILFTISLAACSTVACSAEESGGGSSLSIRDSAGIAVVENGPIPVDAPMWTVTGPILEIGSFDGAPEYQMFQVVGALRLPDGTTVVANRGSHELRWYGPDGGHIRSVGREGEGPGEFSNLSLIGRRADSIVVYDSRQRRYSIVGVDGTFVRSFELPAGETFPRPTGLFSDGSLLLLGGTAFGTGAEPGVTRSDVEVSVLGSDVTVTSDVGTFPGQEVNVASGDDFVIVSPFLGSRSFQTAVVADRIVMGDSDKYEYREYGRSGAVRRIVRLDQPQVEMTSGDHARVRAKRLEATDEAFREQMREVVEAAPEVETLASFEAIRPDPDGNVWIRDALHPEAEHQLWTVFDPEGRALSKIRFEVGFRPLEFGSDYVLGVFEDELDVERVQLWSLEKPEDVSDKLGN